MYKTSIIETSFQNEIYFYIVIVLKCKEIMKILAYLEKNYFS